MDYYSSSAPRGRSSYRGSYRGSSRGESSYRGSRGSRGSRPRGRGAASTYYPKYESTFSKYGSSESSDYGIRSYEGYHRRSESSFSSREHRDDISPSRKRVRTDSYGGSQALYSRRDDEYRGRFSGSHAESRYEERRAFKKPRSEFKSIKDDYRVKDSIRSRSVRGRSSRGISRRGRENIGSRLNRLRNTTASTSEILAIRRAKLLQKRLKEETADKAKGEDKDAKESENEDATAADGEKEGAEDKEEGGKKETSTKGEVERVNAFGKPFIKLQCPQCNMKCITFTEYQQHLYSPIHVKAMKEKSDELKATLASMRIAQREKQKALDTEDLTSMTTRSFFCLICKLNCSQDRGTHQSSELHKKLKAFLMPYCRTCRMPFQSPMSYETHLCSLTHIRRQHSREERDVSGSGIPDKFMVLDSVSGGDEADEKEEDKEKEEKKEPEMNDEDLNLGVEFIRTVKSKYCEVCRTYLPRSKDLDKVIKRHCRTKEHLRCYLHFGNEALLEKMNESGDEEGKKKENEKPAEEKEADNDEGLEGDKLWDGLDKLLDETQPDNKSDDEDEEEGGRFDKFKTGEKKENGDISAEEGEKDDSTTELASSEVSATISA